MTRLILLGAIILLSGCARLGAAARVDPPIIARYPVSAGCTAVNNEPKDKAIKQGAIDLDCFKFPEANGDFVANSDSQQIAGRLVGGTVTKPAVANGVISMTITDAKVNADVPAYDLAVSDRGARNRLTSILLSQADEICVKDSAAIIANEAATNGILNILTTGLASAGSVVTGERAKTILAGTAGFISGSRDHINAAIYRNQVSQAITAASGAERKRLRDAIDARRAEEVTSFSVDDMIRMVNEYHQACSFYKGLELALTTSTKYPAIAAFAARQQALSDLKLLEDQLEAADTQRVAAAALPDDQKAEAQRQAQQNYNYVLEAIGRARTTAFGTQGATPPAEAPKQ